MHTVSLPDAAGNLESLINQINTDGTTVLITRGGQPVARILPVRQQTFDPLKRKQALESIAQLRKELPSASLEEIKASIEEGRE